MISTDELDAIRADITATLPDTAVVQRVTRTPDGQGGNTRTWATHVTVGCRLDPAGGAVYPPGGETTLADRDAATATWIATMPHNTDVTRDDRIVVNGHTLEVLAVPTDRSWALSTRALCREVL